jgi:hypothetical protein
MFHVAGGIILAAFFFKCVLPLIGFCLVRIIQAIYAPFF